MNFYRADPALTDLLRIHLPDPLFRISKPHLDRLGGLAGGHLDECARLADRHVPVLHQRDALGATRNISNITRLTANWRRPRSANSAFTRFVAQWQFWGGRDKYPVVAKQPSLPVQPGEFGLGCPINVTDGCAKLLANFGSDALKAKYLDGLTQTDMGQADLGGQFMTEKKAAPTSAKLTTTRCRKGPLASVGEKWFCSNADAEVVMLFGAAARRRSGTRGVGLFLMPPPARGWLANPTASCVSRTSSAPARWRRARSSWKARIA